MIRNMMFVNYPTGIPRPEAEKWYLNDYLKEAKGLSTLRKLVAYRALEYPADFDVVMPHRKRFDWLMELWYDDFGTWAKANIEKPPKYTKPPGGWDFVRQWESVFIGEMPDNKFLEKSLMERELARTIRQVCLINFELRVAPDMAPEKLAWDELEDWYIDYHARETVKLQPELRNYFSSRVLGYNYTKTGDGVIRFGLQRQCRVTEVWYADFASWRKSIEKASAYTPPSGGWQLMRNWQAVFVGQKPDVSL